MYSKANSRHFFKKIHRLLCVVQDHLSVRIGCWSLTTNPSLTYPLKPYGHHQRRMTTVDAEITATMCQAQITL